MKVLKWAGIFLAILLAGLLIVVLIFHESKPALNPSEAADAMAEKMLQAVNKEAWDSTRFVSWTFRQYHYVWDKANNQVAISWEDNKVILHTKTVTGKAYINGELVEDPDKTEKMVKRVWSAFCNDSFWLNAVVKAFDPGTQRSIVQVKDGRKGLMVSYTSGGVTPGDSYVWLLDDNYRPTSFKMWVSIIPVGGLEASWEDWTQLATGAWVATTHKIGSVEVPISDIKGAMRLQELQLGEDVFAGVE